MKSKPKTVDEYIAAAPKEAQTKLREMRTCIRSAAPGAVEALKWSMPSFSHDRILVIYGAFKRHIGFYPTPSALRAFAKEIASFKHARGSVQFPLDKPLPLQLIREITAFRVGESAAKDAKWKSKSKSKRNA